MLTIAIPTYKRPKYLEQAIDSAIKQNSHHMKYKIIVVNNDPDADMSYYESKYSNSEVDISFYKNDKNLGMLGNVNRCVSLADTRYVAFLHDDDLLMPNYIAEIEKYLNKNIKCLIPQRYLLFENNCRNQLERKRVIKKKLVEINPKRWLTSKKLYVISPEDNIYSWQNCYGAPSCGVIFEKEALVNNRLFFPEGTYSWDFISFLHLNKKEKIYILPKPVSVYRMTSGLSMKSETKKDFFVTYENLKEHYSTNSFVQKYSKEISYLNYLVLDETAENMIDLEKYSIVKSYSSKVKYIFFMMKRLFYWSDHHLDVEIPLSKKAKKILAEMEIL